jgi:NAD(P)-dependent dehydrogenase (short-subunit alcohol dehydrogenase family)
MARVFITGSSDGLGLMAAKLLIEQGHEVVVYGRNEDRSRQCPELASCRFQEGCSGDQARVPP